jgi:MGT family glycosyltransferase
MPQEFDFPRRNLPQHFHYLGPWFDAESSAGIAFPFERLNGRPLVYGSLGTLQSSGNNCFRIMAEACAGLNVQLVLATGRNSESDLTHLPGEPLVRDYVPQTDILSRAALTLTHGGMNTTLQSLHFGVPAIALPLTHDQPAIAARLARSGAGLAIPLRSLTAPRLRAAIETALQQTSIVRSRAKALQQHIAAAGGADRAAETAETLVFERRL